MREGVSDKESQLVEGRRLLTADILHVSLRKESWLERSHLDPVLLWLHAITSIEFS